MLRTVRKPQPRRLIGDQLGFVNPARGGGYPSGQSEDPAAFGEERVPSPDQKPFHTATIPTT